LADFKTALEALAKGELKLETLSKQLDILLGKTPKFANNMLVQLDEIYGQKKLDDKQYAHLKRQINEFRRTHATETEGGATAGGPDSTVFASDSAVEEKAPTPPDNNQAAPDSTVVMSDDEKASNTNAQNTSSNAEDFFDISMPGGADTATPSITSATGPTGTEWNDPAVPTGDLSGGYGVGSVIKQRFKLEKVLGIGGMGKVYKALDLLKAEAKDKKPHVAIKLLNDDFKDHPEAFISLQREASRQQKLAHPNIATIYDFDRVGGPNTPVYITMELMEGMELKDFIKKKVRPKGGLPFDEAFDIVKQLGAGLTYAHNLRLVHSDFKPGNAFMCDDGTVKTLDFGIARAVKNPLTGEAEKTLFDPGKLGALTPAYASLEMLEGEEPDTRDDTYALGCTAYELLTTKHPFNKLPANKACENNLVPPYIKHLNKKQNRALRRSVAFHREDRSPTVAHFVDEFEGKATWHKNPFVIAAAVLLVISLMLIAPALDYLHQQELEGMIVEINSSSGNEAIIVAKLDEMRLLEKADLTTVADEAKENIQNYLSDKVTDSIITAEGNYDYSNVDNVLNEIEEFYPDSIYLQEKTALLTESKKRVISDLTTEYVTALKDESLIGNTKVILDNIEKVDSENALLKDTSPSNAYRLLAQEKLNANDYDAALTLVESGIEFSEGADQRLIDMKENIVRIQTIAKLENELGTVQGQLTTLSDFKQQQDPIIELAGLKPNSELLATLSTQFKPVIDAELTNIQKDGSREEAEAFAADFGDLMNGLQLSKELTQIKLAKLTGEGRKQKATELASESTSKIETALADAQIDDTQWETALLKDIQQLGSLVSEDDSISASLEQYRKQIADKYIAKANETLQAERFDAAENYIDRGVRYAPELQSLTDTRSTITSAREESDRLARVEDNKIPFQSFTEGNNIAEAGKIFEQFKTDLAPDDLYLTTEAAPMLADAYARLAKSKAETKDYSGAYSFVTEGLKIDPNNIDLNDLQNEYQSEANIIELTELFKTAISFPAEMKQKVGQIANANPARFAEFSNASANVLAERIKALRTTDENAAASLANNAASLFSASPVLADLKKQLQLKPWDQFTNANAAIKAGKLTQATQIQQDAATDFTGHPQFVQFSDVLAKRIQTVNEEFNDYLKDKEAAGENYDDLRLAKKLLQRVKRKWSDSPDYASEETTLDELIAKYKPVAKSKIRTVEKELTTESIASTDTGTGATAEAAPWKPIASDSECTNRLAGYGKRAKAICFDMIHSSARGPLMVVVPNGEGIEKSFAIAKYEVSVSDWSKYCILSGTCKPIKDKARKNDPMTGITLQQAQDYAKWLTERTGKTYRIPTKSEWEYAANAGGKQPKKDFNCRVTVQEKLIKGTGIVSVKSGKSNGWGLKNYVGNVQEWVIDGNNTTARGGAFTDAHSKCDISLERSHDGNADDATGFRLIREDVG
jgi:serine/threonine protein kinase